MHSDEQCLLQLPQEQQSKGKECAFTNSAGSFLRRCTEQADANKLILTWYQGIYRESILNLSMYHDECNTCIHCNASNASFALHHQRSKKKHLQVQSKLSVSKTSCLELLVT
jgi:hypothetical protein